MLGMYCRFTSSLVRPLQEIQLRGLWWNTLEAGNAGFRMLLILSDLGLGMWGSMIIVPSEQEQEPPENFHGREGDCTAFLEKRFKLQGLMRQMRTKRGSTTLEPESCSLFLLIVRAADWVQLTGAVLFAANASAHHAAAASFVENVRGESCKTWRVIVPVFRSSVAP
jgi:hypothetical protein